MESAVRFFQHQEKFWQEKQELIKPTSQLGALHGQQDKASGGIQWLRRQIPGLIIYLRANHLPILLKLYGLIPIYYHYLLFLAMLLNSTLQHPSTVLIYLLTE